MKRDERLVSIPESTRDIVLKEMRRYYDAYARYLNNGHFEELEFYMAYAAEVEALAAAIKVIEEAA
jgi:hypothetical protein